MTCLSIAHYLVEDNDNLPTSRKKLHKFIVDSKEFRYVGPYLCCYCIIPKTTHYNSANLISVSEPEVGIVIPLSMILPINIELAKEYVKGYAGTQTPLQDYYRLVKKSYPELEITTFKDANVEEGADTEQGIIYSVDVLFVDQNLVTLNFLNEKSAREAVDLLRSAM